MANVMSLKQIKNKPSRNGFDLSKRNIFSAKAGELLPVYCKEVIPGDKFKINVKSFTRTMPVNTAAYTRIKEYYDWFFVPTNLLWNKFNTFVTQMSDNPQHANSISSSQNVTDTHPYFQLEYIWQYLNYMNTQYYNDSTPESKNIFGFNRAELSKKLIHYLGYPNIQLSTSGVSYPYYDNPAMNPFPLLAYQKIVSDYFRDSQWQKNDPSKFNVDYLVGDNLEIPVLDLYNEDNIGSENMFDLAYCNWNKDLFTGVKPNSQYGDAASINFSTLDDSINDIKWSQINRGLSLVNIGANFTGNKAFYLPTRATGTSYETGQAIQTVTVNTDGTLDTSTADDASFLFDRTFINKLGETLSLGLKSNFDISSFTSAFTVLALRQAEALQKWKEITQSQQQDYKAQIEAHFGVSVSDAYSERCKYIDGFSDVIDINEVTNNNITGDNIADIAGRGVGTQDGYTSFSSDVHGYLICIYHAVPLLDYALQSRVPKQMLKTNVIDYAIPELDKTGMVQVPMIEMTNDVELNEGQLIGYAPRYYDYKTDVDEVHGSALNANSAWVAPFDDTYLKNLLFGGNALSDLQSVSWQFFKVNPQVLDPIFAAQTQSDASPDSDQLLTNCMFDIKCVRNLDYDGLPY